MNVSTRFEADSNPIRMNMVIKSGSARNIMTQRRIERICAHVHAGLSLRAGSECIATVKAINVESIACDSGSYLAIRALPRGI